MADVAVAITPGGGANIATELQGGLSYQVVVPGAHQTQPFTETIISVAANGDNIVVAAVPAKRIYCYGFIIMATAAAVNVRWRDGAAGTSLFGAAFPLLGQGASWMMPLSGLPLFGPSLTVNTDLMLNLSAAQNVSGRIWTIAV